MSGAATVDFFSESLLDDANFCSISRSRLLCSLSEGCKSQIENSSREGQQ